MPTLRETAVAYFNAHPQAKREMIAKGRLLESKEAVSGLGPSNVAAVIRDDELRYWLLLARAPHTIGRILGGLDRFASVTELARLSDECGIDPETACAIPEQPCDTALIQEVRRVVGEKHARAQAVKRHDDTGTKA